MAFVGSYNYNSYSPSVEAIPFEQIGRTVGFGLSIFLYVRIGMSTYRFGKRLYKKYKIKSSKQLLLKQAKFFTTLVYITPALCKRRKIYYFAIS